jgi:2Fe-2S ferredoxin
VSSCKIIVHDQNSKRITSFSCDASKTILENLLDQKISIDHSCGGMGTCGTCRIEILESSPALGAANEVEQEFISERGWTSQERLACQNLANTHHLSIRIKS